MIEVSALQRIPRFTGVSREALDWLSIRFQRKRYDRKQMIFQEGESCKSLQLIEVGTVRVVKTLESGRELILNIFRQGESVGEVALIDGADYPASAWTQDDTIILELSKEDYFEMSKKFHEIPFATIRDLNLRVRSMAQRVHELGSGNVESRLARFFLAFSKTGKPRGDGLWIPIYLSRQELADMVGVRIETVIRIMSQWHKEKILETHEDGFLLPNRDLLNSILEGST